jgi:N-acetyl-anhydromuramoyl-L-alanine amidase
MERAPSLTIDRGTGLADGATLLLSPNRDARPPAATVDLIVIHGISLPPGGYAGDEVEAFFQNRLDTGRHPYYATIGALRVSAHFYLRRDGRLVQFVPVHERAWHAGVSVYGARDACNDFAVGIELEGTDEEPYDERQYPALAALIVALRRAYPTLAADALAGHSDIAPARKTDPGPHFDWERLRQMLAELAAPAQAGG